ncbi:MAG TPA: alkaline phosphatase family protein [Micromonosporaceae bacterium]|nr:alkaline phosphatase family protein [Micromonosporaceae bacterium]
MALVCLAGLTACTNPPPTAPRPTLPATLAPTPAAPPPSTTASHPDHVVVVIFENKSYAQIANDPRAGYLHSLMNSAALFTNAHAVTHPSQPNYLALFSGSTQGVTSDHCPVRLPGRPNLGAQLRDAGFTFTGYSEDLAAPGDTGCGHRGYAAKHNPWVDFDNLPADVNQPYSAFPTDYARLPTVAFVVPNLCHDMHDCSIAAGDQWLRSQLDPYLSWAYGHNSLLIVTFDEDDGSRTNQILTLVAGARVRAGRYPQRITHYTVLATVERLYGLPPLGEAVRAEPIGDLLR